MTAGDGTHECPAAGCTVRCPYNRLACPAHWRQIPRELQGRIVARWQEGDLEAYMAARREAVALLGGAS